jgi:hypothetical protein
MSTAAQTTLPTKSRVMPSLDIKTHDKIEEEKAPL